MPRPLPIADLAPGQIINFRTATRPWIDYEVAHVDASRGMMYLKLPADQSSTPRVYMMPLVEVLETTLFLVNG